MNRWIALVVAVVGSTAACSTNGATDGSAESAQAVTTGDETYECLFGDTCGVACEAPADEDGLLTPAPPPPPPPSTSTFGDLSADAPISPLTLPTDDKSKVGYGVYQCTSKDNNRDLWQVKCPPNQVATCEKDRTKQQCVQSTDPTNPPAPANGNIIGYVGAIAATGCVAAAVNTWGGSAGTVATAADLEIAAKAFCAAKKGTELACQAYFTKACGRLTGGPAQKSCLEWTFLACRLCPAN